ncbi:class V lanthionine synthetase subunit LxmK [Kitasatospora sp. GAS204B]|uniref:class V lanthionine synthetase subunit LxmK n=1 Tax=unclassified Kitasatospora TaxID=2633591 RepID=UPI002473E120|nr:class V lanthionine synthetase subunit LxmK [Kitasatospora sp. GAS204B]MDH6121987.1 hypothetical protein [Kitasatospora sp. GAS204B]
MDLANKGYAAPDLAMVPEVDALLRRLGHGPFDRDRVRTAPGRNLAWLGPTESGGEVFVKRLVGAPADVAARLARLLAFEAFADRVDAAELRRPRLLGCDEPARLVAFGYLDEPRSGAQLMVEESFDDELAFAAGQAIGALHAAAPDPAERLDRSRLPLPSLELLRGIPEKLFDTISFGQISAWSLFQNDPRLAEGIAALLAAENAAPRVPTHGDLRLDQFLVSGGELYVTDWEEFRLADPARDVGSFAGEWLYRSVLDIVTTRGDAAPGSTAFVDFELDHETVLRRGVEKLARLRPRTVAFWRGYRAVRPEVDPGLAERATAFAGWHTLDRLMASATRTARLSGIERAAAGVGRAALLEPAKFAATLGFEETA